MSSSNKKMPNASIKSKANIIFDEVLYSYANTLPEKKKELFLTIFFRKAEIGYLPRESTSDLNGMLDPIIEALELFGDIKKTAPLQFGDIWKTAPPLKLKLTACICCWNALNEKVLGNTDEAWFSLVEASYCLGSVNGLNSHKEAINNNSSEAASVLAKMRHSENYALADDALKFWRDNISPNLSAQKAATELTRVVPLSHKKLAEIVSAEKNKVSRLRTTEPERKA